MLSLFTLLQSVSGLSLINSLIIIWLFPCVCVPLCYMYTFIPCTSLSHMLPHTISRETRFFTSCIMCSTGQSFTFLFSLKLTPFLNKEPRHVSVKVKRFFSLNFVIYVAVCLVFCVLYSLMYNALLYYTCNMFEWSNIFYIMI